MATARKLGDVLNSRRQGHGCRVCGEPTDAAVSIMIQALVDSKPSGPARSQQASLCEKHAVELWDYMLAGFPFNV